MQRRVQDCLDRKPELKRSLSYNELKKKRMKRSQSKSKLQTKRQLNQHIGQGQFIKKKPEDEKDMVKFVGEIRGMLNQLENQMGKHHEESVNQKLSDIRKNKLHHAKKGNTNNSLLVDQQLESNNQVLATRKKSFNFLFRPAKNYGEKVDNCFNHTTHLKSQTISRILRKKSVNEAVKTERQPSIPTHSSNRENSQPLHSIPDLEHHKQTQQSQYTKTTISHPFELSANINKFEPELSSIHDLGQSQIEMDHQDRDQVSGTSLLLELTKTDQQQIHKNSIRVKFDNQTAGKIKDHRNLKSKIPKDFFR